MKTIINGAQRDLTHQYVFSVKGDFYDSKIVKHETKVDSVVVFFF